MYPCFTLLILSFFIYTFQPLLVFFFAIEPINDIVMAMPLS